MIRTELHDDHCSGCGTSLDKAVRYEREDVEPEHRRLARGWRRISNAAKGLGGITGGTM